MKKILIPFTFVLVLVIVYLAGPKFDDPVYNQTMPNLNLTIDNVSDYVANHEELENVRPDNEARIVWFDDSLRNKTEFCLLYLHGFSASWYEGNPTHINLAKALSANLYLSRLAGHGLEDPDAFMQMTPSNLYESAKEALEIANSLGQKVIIMGTSTGGTLALKLAADFPNLVAGLLLLSPNIEINNPAAFLLDGHWGITVARQSNGGKLYRDLGEGLLVENKYWYRKYRWEGTVYLQQLLKTTMKKEVFENVTQPVFVGYYYRDEQHQDPVVKVSAMLKMFDELGTPQELKQKMAFPNANNHVIGCKELSDSSMIVENELVRYCENTFKVQK